MAAAFTDEQLRQAYRRKVENQELSLLEFSQRKTELKSRPSKVMIELACNHAALSYELFEKAATSLFEDAYYVDLRGIEYSSIDDRRDQVFDVIEKYPLVNWSCVTPLRRRHPHILERMAALGFMLGLVINELEPGEEGLANCAMDLAVLNEARRRHGRGFVYGVVILRKDTIKCLPELVRIGAAYGVPELQFKLVTYFQDFELDPMAMAPVLNQCLDLALEKGVRLTINDQRLIEVLDISKVMAAAKLSYPDPVLNFPPPFSLDPNFARVHTWQAIDTRVTDRHKVAAYQKCFKPFHYVNVNAEGKVGPCNHMLVPELRVMGQLTTHSFDEIWNNDQYRGFREELLKGKPMDGRCQWCFQHRMDE